MDDSVLFVVLVSVGSITGGALGYILTQFFRRDREKRFLRFVRIILPNAKVIECITVATSDRQAIENIERRIRNASRTL